MMKLSTFMGKLHTASVLKTVYCLGMYGHYLTPVILAAKIKQYPAWYTAARISRLSALTMKGYFCFDCVNMIKGILWGWWGDNDSPTGGANYGTHGVPDTNANGYFARCKNKSTNFKNITVGAMVWIEGHIGVYKGNGEVYETTYRWDDGVQITGMHNLGDYRTKSRRWASWGLSPDIDYASVLPDADPETPADEDINPAGDQFIHPDDAVNPNDVIVPHSGEIIIEGFKPSGFRPLGAAVLYTCAESDLIDSFPPLMDGSKNPVPDGAICEVLNPATRQYSNIYRMGFNRWWKYGNDINYLMWNDYPNSPLSFELYPVQIIAFDYFTSAVSLLMIKEDLYKKYVFFGGHVSLTGRKVERVVGKISKLINGAWTTPIDMNAQSWTVVSVKESTRNIYETKTGIGVWFEKTSGVMPS